MGWNLPFLIHARSSVRTRPSGWLFFFVLGALLIGFRANAQTVPATNTTTFSNGALMLTTYNTAFGVYFELKTAPGNATDPNRFMLDSGIVPRTPGTDPKLGGSLLYVRIDGGFSNLSTGGYD